MSGLQRIDRMTMPPIKGRYYLVSTVRAEWHGMMSDWPVIGPKHTDVEFFDFHLEHYHIDGRFLSAKQRSHCYFFYRTLEESIQASPVHAARDDKDAKLPKPVLARRRCWSDDLKYAHHEKKQIKEIASHFAGVQCDRGKSGWICPHRKAALGSVAVVDGVVTCPLHGLRINAETGRVASEVSA